MTLTPSEPKTGPKTAGGAIAAPGQEAAVALQAEAALALKPPHPLAEFWHYFSENKGAVAGLIFIVVIIIVALFAPQVAPHHPYEMNVPMAKLPPVWLEGGQWSYLLGTDALGRDILSRIIFGARLSLMVGAVVVTLSLVAGVGLGLLAGFLRGWVDVVIMRLMDIILSVPSLLLAIAIVAILGPGLENAMAAIAVVVLPHYTRLTRAAVMTEATKDYVTASRVAGASKGRLMVKTILPNTLAPLIVQATLGFSTAILDAAALGFLGLGARPPRPEWGTMLSEAREFVLSHWWIVTFPGLAILFTVLAFNLMGDGLRDALDPRMKR
ncbi:dipeptide ABC transporter permease DppC [Rhodospirillum rubrum]|uniref:ABC transporter permease subunit n=1 Tax=Rhodospirillum rubrum TaxID=1085 RepID=UPI0019039643|nr:ABC transporter permease subunit [Rhodospirillum rubrum]MBK1663603.1 dipeptide ABC transporter permease DppC [Rhodospirillum rubrum]